MTVKIYTQRICGYCVNAKRLLDQLGIPYEDISLEGNDQLRAEIMKKSGQRTVPQIWIGEHHVGGFTELYDLHRSKKLNDVLMQHNG